ncbi:MAG: restriction endonuclease subunit S [Acutalibacteraceae bacterium]|nr:restriction endonuclease subunit S [Acutalibacteraceae bacterium]
MSKLDEMIAELCPDGVEYKKLSEIATVSRGVRVVREQLKTNGKIPVYQNSLKPLGYHDKANVTANTAFVIGAGAAGEIGFSDVDFWAADDCYYFECSKELNNRYLYFILMKNQPFLVSKVRKASIPRLSRTFIDNLVIPVPPLEIQAEIVKILDNFTELTAELTAELEARKKQYEYYRDYLLNFGRNGGVWQGEWRTLGEVIVTLKTGLNPRQNFVLNEKGSVLPYVTGKDIFNNAINISERTDKITLEALNQINKRASLEKGLLLFASTGTGTVGRMAIIETYNNGWGISETLYAIKVNEEIMLTKYLMYYLYSANAKSQYEPKISKGSVPHLKVKDLQAVKVPILPLEEQQRIVAILDRFDKLCNDLTDGLPAEIEARKKQYEYYRDKLLTFKVKE